MIFFFWPSSQDQDVYSFIDTSMALESIAASAYIGILQFFNNKVRRKLFLLGRDGSISDDI